MWKALFVAWTCIIISSAIIVWILQGNDPGKFELILKIQSLQKRLIVKTQGLEERELLLQVYSSSRSEKTVAVNFKEIIGSIALGIRSLGHFRFWLVQFWF